MQRNRAYRMGESDCKSSEKDGKIRVCLDPIQLNKAIQREHYQLPTRDEIHAKFKDAHYFRKLDARTGFWQMIRIPQNLPVSIRYSEGIDFYVYHLVSH